MKISTHNVNIIFISTNSFFHFVNTSLISRITHNPSAYKVISNFDAGQLIQSKSHETPFTVHVQHKWPTYLVWFTACHSLNLTLLSSTVCACVYDKSVEIVVANFDKINYSTFWPIKFQKLNWMLRIFVTQIFVKFISIAQPLLWRM